MDQPPTPKTSHQDIDATIARANSIGGLERLAGVGSDHESRYAFWKLFAHLPANQSLDAGVAELKRRIHTNAAARSSIRG